MSATVDLAHIDAAAPETAAAWARVVTTDREGLAGLVEAVGGAVRDDPGLAARVLERLLASRRELPIDDHEPQLWYLLAQARVAEGRLADALGHIEQARLAFQARGDDLQAVRTNLGRTNVLFELARHDEALDASVEVLAVFATTREGLDESERRHICGRAHVNAGVCHEYAGRFQAALVEYAAAIADFAATDDGEMVASVLHNRAWVLMALGKVSEAADDLRRAIDLYREARVRALVVIGHVALVRAHVEMGEYAEALEVLDAAGDVLDEIDAPERRYDYLSTSAEAYASLNLLREAVDLYRRILKWQTESGFEVERARAAYGLGRSLCRLGELAEAGTALDDAVQTFGHLGHAGWLARALAARAEVAAGEGAIADAHRLLERAVDVAEHGGAPAEALQARLALADLHDDEALAAANLDRARALGIAPLVAHAAHTAGRHAIRRGALTTARALLVEAASIVERQRRSLTHEAFLVGFGRDKNGLADDLVRLELVDPDRSPADALAVVEGAKSRSLRELAAGACRRGRTVRADDEADRVEADLHATYRAMFVAAAEDPAGFDRLRRRAAELEGQFQRVRLDDVRSTVGDLAVGAAAARLPAGDTVVIAYYCLEGQVVALAGTVAEPVLVDLAPVDHVLDLLARFAAQRDRVRLGGAFVERHGARLEQACRNVLGELYDTLVAPVCAHLPTVDGVRPVVVSPHGPLHAVPFHALWTGSSYLVEDWSITVVPSLLQGSRASARPAGAPLVVGVADDLAPLAVPEAQAVHARIGGEVLVGEAATADAFLAAAPGCSVVHLATHAWHRGDNPMFSAVRFADRWLTAAEVLERLDLTGATVVLSACETARSTTTGGDELLGLVRGFLGAGAARLVASLWPADDTATAHLMDRLHHHLTEAHPADALRLAQLDVRARHPHPAHWAPFVALGAP